MPLRVASDFGIAAQGFRHNDYCQFCFADGKFTEPGITALQMLEKTIRLGAAATGRPAAGVRAEVERVLPMLKR